MSGVPSRRVFMWTLAALSLAGCATLPTLSTPEAGETWPELEPLLSVTPGREGLSIRVRSQGCAAKSDFVFRVDRDRGRAVVAFARRRLETCRGAKGEATLSFSYVDLGLSARDRIVVANPIAPRT
ncbi:hypothetical protein [Caulobacter vibrioides]|uniref:Lipoprotein n=2 Tax=Caulobacter vibrioides TaxID=155892 RepID=Q9A5E2_CAUVC|nr:hypothetical protein [Caulobacter vibrioides]YP_002517966.1 hypothetical protein CCNA_02593 [Caulobacter vibrioides NA1000]AAK24479.1 hypothetical protein CC_2508 [Caulobacter vibrioides CB15]ACL96058.1 hypothetical protein CCNA_02593 [Caulobacter vibrioides NA1000]ATC29360.1 hypothetical protein CA607_13590 [Caulobacter vibrioides]QXZ50873.1 hypothetical protein KZH45_13345 [Caulobacter vibrioides]